MSSVKCPQCNLTNWSTAITCKRCGGFLQPIGDGSFAEQAQNINAAYSHQPVNAQAQNQWPPPSFQEAPYQDQYQQQSQYQYSPYGQPNYKYQQPANLKSGLAVASMILGILGVFTSIFLIGILAAPIGLILGIIALTKANKKPNIYGGKGYAIAGIVTSSIIVLFIPIIAAIAIPNLLAARRAANEGSAISTLKTLSAAEATYMASSSGKCGDIQTLIATKLIDVNMAKSEKSGYRFTVVSSPVGGCELLATPITTSHGTRSFYYSTEDGILRGGPKNGLPADRNDFPIKNGSSDQLSQSPQPAQAPPPAPQSPLDKPNEAGALSSLRTLHSAEITYAATAGRSEWGSLQTLALQGLIKQDLGDSIEYGYQFKVVKLQQTGWGLYATPISSGSGSRSFYIGADGVIHAANKNGSPADSSDPPLSA